MKEEKAKNQNLNEPKIDKKYSKNYGSIDILMYVKTDKFEKTITSIFETIRKLVEKGDIYK